MQKTAVKYMLADDAELVAGASAELHELTRQIEAARLDAETLTAQLRAHNDAPAQGGQLTDIGQMLELAWANGERAAVARLIAALVYRIDLRRDGPTIQAYTIPATATTPIVPLPANLEPAAALALHTFRVPDGRRRVAA
jgi:hypothetical protein